MSCRKGVTINRKPSVLKRIICFFLAVCPRCEQTMKASNGLVYYFCQTKGCLDPEPYAGPERRRTIQ